MEISKILKAKEIINNAKKIVVLSGAGLDTDSGIPDFRSSKGVYSKAPEEILHIDNFYNDTEKTIKFIKDNIFFLITNQMQHILFSLIWKIKIRKSNI